PADDLAPVEPQLVPGVLGKWRLARLGDEPAAAREVAVQRGTQGLARRARLRHGGGLLLARGLRGRLDAVARTQELAKAPHAGLVVHAAGDAVDERVALRLGGIGQGRAGGARHRQQEAERQPAKPHARILAPGAWPSATTGREDPRA